MLPYAATAAGALVLLALLLRRRRKPDSHKKIKTLVVLGSGGHTAEMLRLITDFDFDRYGPLTLVTAYRHDEPAQGRARAAARGAGDGALGRDPARARGRPELWELGALDAASALRVRPPDLDGLT